MTVRDGRRVRGRSIAVVINHCAAVIVMACCIGILIAVMLGDIDIHMASRMIVVMAGDSVIVRMCCHQAAMRHGHQGTDQDENEAAHVSPLSQRQ